MARLSLSFAALIMSANAVSSFTDTYQDCLEFASLFQNTCDSLESSYSHVSKVPSVTQMCSDDVGQCAGTYNATDYTCSWEAKLCVTCDLIGTETKIRVQSNGLPQQCYYSPDIDIVEQNIDFEVKWNWDVAFAQNNLASTDDELDDLLCEDARLNNGKIPHLAGFVKHGANSLANFGGVFFTGIPVSTVLNSDDVDPYNPPATYTEYNFSPVDQCGSYPDENGKYQSHFAPACYADESLQTNFNLVAGHDAVEYVDNAFDSFGHQEPIGIAKDGHIIWGPKNAEGQEWNDCELDICNGLFVDGFYGYAATNYFPYTVGCYGPGNYNTLAPTCSGIVRQCSQSELDALVTEGEVTIISGATLLQLSAASLVAASIILN